MFSKFAKYFKFFKPSIKTKTDEKLISDNSPVIISEVGWVFNPTITFGCNYVQNCARIVQKMSKKVQEKLLLE